MKEQIEFGSEDMLYLVNPTGLLRTLRTPFRALCIKESIGIPVGTWAFVDAVYSSREFKIAYQINGYFHAYNHFQITINF
ncbi:MAG: hypothetical protein ACK41Z_04255 [Sediminibacterium sp.]